MARGGGRCLRSGARDGETRQLSSAEQALSTLLAEAGRIQSELHGTSDWEARAAIGYRGAQNSNAQATANKHLNAARKVANAASTREVKAVRQLSRVHAQAVAVSIGLPPLQEELSLLACRLRIAVEADGLSSAEATELAEMDRRKEAAAARVSEAMQSLEIMSNEIHERRKERGGEEDAGSEYGGSEALDDTVSSNGDAAEGAAAAVEAAASVQGTPGVRYHRPSALGASPARKRRGTTGPFTPIASSAVTRLLLKASELVNASPTQPPIVIPTFMAYA